VLARKAGGRQVNSSVSVKFILNGGFLGILDSILGETTKWLLQKADKVFDTNRSRAFVLYEQLYKIDECFEKYGNHIFHFMAPPLYNYPFDRIDSDVYVQTYDSFKAAFACGLGEVQGTITVLKIEIDRSLTQFESLKFKITSESKKSKNYWDDFAKFLNALKTNLEKIRNLAVLCFDKNATSEDYRILVKQIKKLEHMLEVEKILKNYLEEYKNYLNAKYPS